MGEVKPGKEERVRQERNRVEREAKGLRMGQKEVCVEKIWTPWLSVIGAWLELIWETKWKLLSPSATTSPVGKLREELERRPMAKEEKERQGKEEKLQQQEKERQEKEDRQLEMLGKEVKPGKEER